MKSTQIQNTLKVTSLLGSVVALMTNVACEKTDRSFSMLSEEQTFKQTSTFIQKKIDILWIVDNSGSMQPSQENLGSNFISFIQKFQSLNLDFHMAVQSTDAYKGKFQNNNNLRQFKDGYYSHSGVFVLDKNTPLLMDKFITNVRLGIYGSSDERAFASIEDTLDYSGNSDFRRSDAFLSVIIVSDEDDFSATSSASIGKKYNDSRIISVNHYKEFLDTYAGVGNYSVNVIGVFDAACAVSGRTIATRYAQLADLSKGIKASICDSNFSSSLQVISEKTVELAATFTLDRAPIEQSLVVKLDSVVVPEDAVNGWTFDSATNTVAFHGAYIPAAGADIKITYDPLVAKQ